MASVYAVFRRTTHEHGQYGYESLVGLRQTWSDAQKLIDRDRALRSTPEKLAARELLDIVINWRITEILNEEDV